MLDIDTICNHLHDVGLLTDDIKKALMDLYEERRSDVKFPFGKYKGKTLEEIATFDVGYLQWAVKQSWMFDDLKTEIKKIL
jgi:uncharacterized protein (DUF3820 family)